MVFTMEKKIPQLAIHAAELDYPEQAQAKIIAALRRTKASGGKLEVVIYEWAAATQGSGAITSGGILSSHPGAQVPKNRF